MDALLQLRTGTDVAAVLTANPELRPVLEPMVELQAGDDVAEAGVPAPFPGHGRYGPRPAPAFSRRSCIRHPSE